MKQADLGLNLTMKRTRKREFLDEMNRVVPWSGSMPFRVERTNLIGALPRQKDALADA